MSLAQFVREYRQVRHAEGWGSTEPAYYRALPYRDLSGRHALVWRIRAKSYDTFIRCVLEPLERVESLKILDLGAGNGWLAFRLWQRGHHVLAIDVLEDTLDGLGALSKYAPDIPALITEFDHLPFASSDFDLAIFNASLHYSTDFVTTLGECLRTLQPGGTLVILDSPMYSDPTSGARMVQEREARFLATYGFASNALPSEHFLTPSRLRSVGSALGIKWQIYRPQLDLRSRLERQVGSLRARREAALFPVIVGTRA